MTRIFVLLILLCYQRKSESGNLTRIFCKSSLSSPSSSPSFLYLTHYLSDFCNPSSTYTIYAKESGTYSSGIFKMTRNDTPYDVDKNCNVVLKIPDNYKVLLSFFYVDIRKNEHSQCVDQLQISHFTTNKLILKPICGRWYNKRGDRTVFPLNSFVMRFKSNSTGYNWNHTGFSFMYTVYNHNSNNSVGIGGYIGLTFAVLLLILILLFLVSPPLKRDSSRVPEIPTISSSCQWHTGTSNFPPPYSEIEDRPPSYEEAVRTNTS
ncbi:uncharacterized protein LOC111638985 [Centruroides sculpturatus]|uniref:uncharacterized protein LOC111638985 n=1 Tax=Centruroides sculpturatus TaxID=218467 RepID=UPI000C6E1D74|nr:uncharacterized protein LOC111638985 [Centruroides sculpturatus]